MKLNRACGLKCGNTASLIISTYLVLMISIWLTGLTLLSSRSLDPALTFGGTSSLTDVSEVSWLRDSERGRG